MSSWPLQIAECVQFLWVLVTTLVVANHCPSRWDMIQNLLWSSRSDEELQFVASASLWHPSVAGASACGIHLLPPTSKGQQQVPQAAAMLLGAGFRRDRCPRALPRGRLSSLAADGWAKDGRVYCTLSSVSVSEICGVIISDTLFISHYQPDRQNMPMQSEQGALSHV